MANLEKDAKEKGLKKLKKDQEAANDPSKAVKSSTSKGIRDDIEQADDEESYYK